MAAPHRTARSKHPKPDPTWNPPTGGVFNNPVGKSHLRLVKRVINAVNNTPKGALIRFAAFSFDRKDVADALIRAHRRGVNVQIVLNDNWTSAQTMRLRHVLGTKRKKASSVRICFRSCRGGYGNLHMKVYSFSQTGAAHDVVITGSANMTDRAANLQWNDLYTMVGVTGLYDTYMTIFKQLQRDRPVRPRWVTWSSSALDAEFYRTDPTSSLAVQPLARGITPAGDPVMQRLESIDCKTSAGYGNAHRRTMIRIEMYGWNGVRGIWLAHEVAALKARGCDIKATLSEGGGKVVRILGAAHIPIQSTDWQYLPDDTVNFYDHLKTIMISGTMNGRPTRSVWTGSENWSGMSFLNDEIILQINDTATWAHYMKQWNKMWASKDSHSFGFHPTGKP